MVTSSAPVVADTIGGTTGMSQPPNALPGGYPCRVTATAGTMTVASRPVRVPAVHSTQSSPSATW